MKKRVTKAKIEEIIYEFDAFDIRDMASQKISPKQPCTIMIDWDCSDTELTFKLIVTYKEEEKEDV